MRSSNAKRGRSATDPRSQRPLQNARLLADLAGATRDGEELLLLCECGAATCGARVRLTQRQSERSRGRGRFIVAPGHGQHGDGSSSPIASWVVADAGRR